MFRLQSAALPCKLFIHFSNKLGTVRVTASLEALKAQKNIQRILQCRRGDFWFMKTLKINNGKLLANLEYDVKVDGTQFKMRPLTWKKLATLYVEHFSVKNAD